MNNEEVAEIIEKLADLVEREESPTETFMLKTIDAMTWMVERKNVKGAQLLNQTDLLLTTKGKKSRYKIVEETVDRLGPLDHIEDVKLLRALAREVREGVA